MYYNIKIAHASKEIKHSKSYEYKGEKQLPSNAKMCN